MRACAGLAGITGMQDHGCPGRGCWHSSCPGRRRGRQRLLPFPGALAFCCTHLSIHLQSCLSLYPFFPPSFQPPLTPPVSIHLSIDPSKDSSVHLYDSPSFHPCLYPPLVPPFHPSIPPSLCLPQSPQRHWERLAEWGYFWERLPGNGCHHRLWWLLHRC